MVDTPRVYKYVYQCANCGKEYLLDNNSVKLFGCNACKSKMTVWEKRFVRVK